MEGFGLVRDTPEKKKVQRNFRDLNHLAVPLGYGEMREASHTFDAALQCLQSDMSMSAVVASEELTKLGHPKYYVGFVKMPDDQSVRQVLQTGITGTCSFDENPSTKYQPEGWHFETKPPLPQVEAPGDLTVLLTRPSHDERDLAVADVPSVGMDQGSSLTVHLFPKMTDEASKRLVSVMGKIREKNPEDNVETVRRLQRILEARDFHDDTRHSLFEALDSRTFYELVQDLRPTQQAAMMHIFSNTRFFSLIQGPPGSSKTFFAAHVARCSAKGGTAVLVCAPSNAAVEVNARVIQQLAPELKPIRVHNPGDEVDIVLAYHRQLHSKRNPEDDVKPTVKGIQAANAIITGNADQGADAQTIPKVDPRAEATGALIRNQKKNLKKKAKKAAKKAANDEKQSVVKAHDDDEKWKANTPSDDKRAEAETVDYGKENESSDDQRSVWVSVISEAMRKDSKWVGIKTARPHRLSMGLAVQALESVGVLKDGELQLVKPDLGPNHESQGFLDAFYSSGTPEQTNPGENETRSLRSWTSDLFKATLLRARIIITTCSNSGSKLVRQNFHAGLIIVDEAAMAKEAETILPIYNNRASVQHVTLIGDPRQLYPTVTSKHKREGNSKEGKLVNKFSEQMKISLMARLYDDDYPTFMFTEQHRMVENIAGCSNTLFYKSAVQNAPDTAITTRFDGQATVAFLQREYQLNTRVPHVFLTVPNGVCMRTPSKSRINLLNIVVDINTIERIVGAGLFNTSEIAVCTPYKEQVNELRQAINKASKLPFWSDRKIFDIEIKTTDSFQGGEKQCIIFDFVFAQEHRGGVGFVSQGGRLNVGITRARDAFFIVGDIDCLEDGDGKQPSKDIDDDDAPTSWDASLRKVLDYYNKERVVVRSVNPYSVSQQQYVDLGRVKAYFTAKKQAEDRKNPRCNNCGQVGHKAEECQYEKVAHADTQCNNCKGFGHFSKDCSEERVEIRVCKHCGVIGHIRKDCPSRPLVKCDRCSEWGHRAAQCEGPDRRQCHRCDATGH